MKERTMSDEEREQLEPQDNTELANDAPVSDEISNDELDNVSGGTENPPDGTNLLNSAAKGTHYPKVKLYLR
jgi:hypothetical protein